MSILEVQNLVCGYGKKEVVHGVSFKVAAGEFVCILGANGCGKTTLLKSLLALIKPFSGDARIAGKSLLKMTNKQRASTVAYLPQAHTPPFPFLVADVVLMGRSPYLDRYSRVKEKDKQVAWEALCVLGIEHLAPRTYTKLSGGQQQLVLIARCLAQQPKIIIMDEPTASLDFGNQQVVLAQMCAFAQKGVSILMVTHDPQHAFYCADRTIVMSKGEVIADGSPCTVMTKSRLESIYQTNLEVVDLIVKGRGPTKACIPLQSELMGKEEGSCVLETSQTGKTSLSEKSKDF